jgi:hypothetical protein
MRDRNRPTMTYFPESEMMMINQGCLKIFNEIPYDIKH